MIQPRLTVAAFALAALLGGAPALAQTSPAPGSPVPTDSAAAPGPADPDAPSANSVDGTGTFSVNPPLSSDHGLGGLKTGPSRTDMNIEADATATAASSSTQPDPKADASDPGSGPQLPASAQ